MTKFTGKKLNMTQIYRDDVIVPVSVIQLDSESNLEEMQNDALVKVSGKSKGKGFQGTVKRHGFSGGPKTHGQKDRLRAPGSIGATFPQRVVPGRKMAGRMGGDRVTVKNLKVIRVDGDKKQVFLKGAVPGNKGGKVEISL